METNLERIKNRIIRISKFNATPGQGFTRFSYSSEDRHVRDYLTGEMQALGLKITVDAVGNIRGRLEGSIKDSPPVLVGSHIDTVFHGGMFDGVVGSVGALEALNVMIENNIIPQNPVEVIFFAEEEGSNFGSTMSGSKMLTGKYTIDDLKKITNDNGLSMYQAAKAFGLNPDRAPEYVIKKGDIKAMLELHIEQSVMLDKRQITIGIIEAISGSICFSVTFNGVPNHAGATPMNMRSDPMIAAAAFIRAINDIAINKAFSTTVCTIGKITCKPNVSNIIAGKVTFTVDIRDVKEEGIKIVSSVVKELAEKISAESGTQYSIKKLAESDVIILPNKITDIIEDSAKELNVSYIRMNSGAVHDSVMLASVTDVGMIFVPSISGRSHVPEENTKFEDIKSGCDILLNTIIRLSSTK